MVVCIDFIGYLRLPNYETGRLYFKARYYRSDPEVYLVTVRLVFKGSVVFEGTYEARDVIDIAEVVEARLEAEPARVECIKTTSMVYPLYATNSFVGVVVGGSGATLNISAADGSTCSTVVPSGVDRGAASLIVKGSVPARMDTGLNPGYLLEAKPVDIDSAANEIDVVVEECSGENCITWSVKQPIYAFECVEYAKARVYARPLYTYP